jgi:hypothetical protein
MLVFWMRFKRKLFKLEKQEELILPTSAQDSTEVTPLISATST